MEAIGEGVIQLYTKLANEQRKRLGLDEFTNMQRIFEDVCNNTNHMRVAQWGDIGNMKTQSQLDQAKGLLLPKVEKVRKFLMRIQTEIEEMKIIDATSE